MSTQEQRIQAFIEDNHGILDDKVKQYVAFENGLAKRPLSLREVLGCPHTSMNQVKRGLSISENWLYEGEEQEARNREEALKLKESYVYS